jgi:5-methyltetrahydrofolate corrinoid/iron sulfur protein methyltransferase
MGFYPGFLLTIRVNTGILKKIEYKRISGQPHGLSGMNGHFVKTQSIRRIQIIMIIAADNIQIIRKSIENAIVTRNPDPIRETVEMCLSSGAEIIDINPGPLKNNPAEKMDFIVNTVLEITRLPIMIDTANPIAMEAGLKSSRGNAIINGFSLEPFKIDSILPLAAKYGCRIVGYLLNPDSSVPLSSSDRLAVGLSLYDKFRNAGLENDQLIIDPVLVPLMWKDGVEHAMNVLEVIKTLPELLGFDIKTIVGLSNLTTGPGDPLKKSIMERSYAAMLSASGTSMVLMNMNHKETVLSIKAASLLRSRSIFTWESLRL